MTRQQFDDIATKDQLGKPDEKELYGPFKRASNVILEQHPTVTLQRDTTGNTRWDQSEWDGADWDYENGNSFVVNSVSNYNNIFQWRFRHTDVYSGAYPLETGFTETGTATETGYTISFTSTGQQWQSKSIHKDNFTTTGDLVISAIVSLTSSGTFSGQMSNNGGTNWESFTVGDLNAHAFTSTGRDLKVKLENTSATGNVSYIKVLYNLGG